MSTAAIWSCSSSNKPSYDDLDRIGLLLVDSVSSFLRLPIMVIEQHLVLNDALVFSFRLDHVGNNPLKLYFEGNILYSINSGLPSLNLELFLFIEEQRVGRIQDKGSSLLKFRGTQGVGGSVQWVSQGLQSDEFEEWAYIKAPQWINRSDVRRTLD